MTFVESVSIVACCALVVGCVNPIIDGVAPAYDPTALARGMIYHWPSGRSLGVYIAPGASERLTAQVAAALGQWSLAMAYREQTLRPVSRAVDADIIVRDAATALPVDTTGCGTAGWAEASGQTLFCEAGDTARTLPLAAGPAGRTKVLITIDVAATADVSELLAVIVHELGHALGIGGHSTSSGDVMYAAPAATRPSDGDIRTLRYVLHRRPDLTL